jgi:ketosteroid isomerase-like protein
LSLLAFPVLVFGKALPPAQAEMVDTERAFAKQAVEQGIRASFIEYFADDGIAFGPHPFNVKEVFSKRPAPATPPAVILHWAPVYGGIARAGDMGWNTGPTVFEDLSPEKKPARHGMFFSVWKKQDDGSWRVALDLGADTPAAVLPLDTPYHPLRRRHRSASPASLAEGNASLLNAESEFLAEAAASSVGQAYEGRLSDDARVHRPGAMPVVGKSALSGWLARQTMTQTGAAIKADVSRSGDLAYAYGRYEMGGASPQKGYFARVWQREEKGQWRIVMDVISPLPDGEAFPQPE